MMHFHLRPVRGPETWTHEVERMLEGFHRENQFIVSEVVETPGAYKILLDVPGVKKEDIHIEVRDRQLVISGERKSPVLGESERVLRSERRFGKFSRSFTLPEGIAEDKAQAVFTDGVLEVNLPRMSVEVRRIPVS